MTSLRRAALPALRTATLIRRTPPAARRMAHAMAGEPYHNVPFDYSNRRRWAAKCLAYMGFGFALPFVAVGWQWYKPGGYKNP
ncbi:hypothetical protein B0H15DRAFT_871992 [Mycena belliarum]|uniref:Cytochrome c oxidase subunit 8, mitochondrial n=1 Tax=Mycena belliarum TaxID=1033014 RepID=A0AAD6XHT1_9AGAR|nr:hypothetical protein B0H15DRAFT_871992 [Mycena belliae]